MGTSAIGAHGVCQARRQIPTGAAHLAALAPPVAMAWLMSSLYRRYTCSMFLKMMLNCTTKGWPRLVQTLTLVCSTFWMLRTTSCCLRTSGLASACARIWAQVVLGGAIRRCCREGARGGAGQRGGGGVSSGATGPLYGSVDLTVRHVPECGARRNDCSACAVQPSPSTNERQRMARRTLTQQPACSPSAPPPQTQPSPHQVVVALGLLALRANHEADRLVEGVYLVRLQVLDGLVEPVEQLADERLALLELRRRGGTRAPNGREA